MPALARHLLVLSGRKRHVKTHKPRAYHQRTRSVYVASPTVPGAREAVQKVFDPIEHLWASGQLGDKLYQAALKFRKAYDTLVSALGGALDFDKIRGMALAGRPPTPPFLAAAEVINDAEKALYIEDFRVVFLIVGEGMRVKDVAMLLGEQQRHTSKTLHRALAQLARQVGAWPRRSA